MQPGHTNHAQIYVSSSAGFTLLELLISLFVLALITSFSLSNTSALYQKNQLQAVTSEIKKAIQTGKLQALSRGESLALTPLTNSTDWSSGMLLFVDNANHQYTPDGKLIYQWTWKSTGVHVSWQGFQSKNYLLFAANLKSNITNGFFIIKDNAHQVKLIVNRLARVRNAE